MDTATATGPDPDEPVQAEPRPLRSFLPDFGIAPGVVTLDPLGTVVVVLRAVDDGCIEVLPPTGPTLTLRADHGAIPVSDTGQQVECLGRAVTKLLGEARSQTAHLDGARADLAAAQQRHTDVLADIREYAISRHELGDICRGGLNEFLRHFDLTQYEPRLQVNYTITGSYAVDNTDSDAATHDGDGYIAVDLSRVDHVVDDSNNFTVTVSSVNTAD